jgi:hypothetical protein
MITKLSGFYSIGGNPVIVDDGLEVSFSDDKELIIYDTEAEFLEAFPEPEPEELEEDDI